MVLPALLSYPPAMSREVALNFTLLAAIVLISASARLIMHGVETRVQIFAACVLAAAIDRFAKPQLEIEPDWRWTVGAIIAATLGILLARWQLEGLCPAEFRAPPRCIPKTLSQVWKPA